VRAIVLKSTGNNFIIKNIKGEKHSCTIKGKLRLNCSKSTNPVVVGDIVEYDENNTPYAITEIKERRNYIVRKSVNLSRQNHVIAANIDQICLVFTLIKPATSTEFIDRYLCTAQAYKIKPIIVFNKTDLYNEQLMCDLEDLKLTYSNIGYKCISISVVNESGFEELTEILQNKISLFSGNSGVGKTSIINKILPNCNLKIADISEYHQKGKHTTTFSEMLEYNENSYIIDTPGIKGFGLININKSELFHYFPEFLKLITNCQYYNCTHTHEPNCAVKNAVVNGKIAESRYKSYINIFTSENEKHRS